MRVLRHKCEMIKIHMFSLRKKVFGLLSFTSSYQLEWLLHTPGGARVDRVLRGAKVHLGVLIRPTANWIEMKKWQNIEI